MNQPSPTQSELQATIQQRHDQRESDLLAILGGGPVDTNIIVDTLRVLARDDLAGQLYVGWDHGAVRGHLRALERRGLVRRENQGWAKPIMWELTEQGQELAGV